MESPMTNLYNQFHLMRAQMDGLSESIEPRKLLQLFVLEFVPSVWRCGRHCDVIHLVKVIFNCKTLKKEKRGKCSY